MQLYMNYYSISNANWQAWQLWNEGKQMEFVDPMLMQTCPTAEVEMCMHVALLCVQEDPADRPTVSSVIVLLGGETLELPQPKKPAFSVGKMVPIDKSLSIDPSVNQITISSVSPR